MTPLQALGLALRWYVVASAVAILLYPLVFRATPGLPDRGLSLARPLSLLVAVGIPWWLSAAGPAPFGTWEIVAAVAVIGLIGWALEARRRSIVSFLRREWRTALVLEALCLVLFLGYVAFRGFNPDIAFTEKPMDFAFLKSAMLATHMPPADPWFAGQPINYYYLGYVLMAALARLSGTAAPVAFNLALATLFAYAATGAAGTAANIARVATRTGRRQVVLAGGLGVFFLVGIGNFVTPVDFLRSPSATLSAGWWEGVGWNASRVIVDNGIPGSPGPHPTINEFPAFTFVLGDLHPHVLDLPFFLSAIGLGLGLARCRNNEGDGLSGILPLGLAGATIGALYAINSWDMPTALLLAAGGIVLGSRSEPLRRRALSLAVLVAAAAVAALPFALHYAPAVGVNPANIPPVIRSLPVIGFVVRTIGVVVWPRSSAASLLTIHGFFLAVALVFIGSAWILVPRTRRPSVVGLSLVIPFAALVAVASRLPALFLFGAPLAALGWLLARARLGEALRFVAWLFFAACMLVLVAELFFLQDAFGDRMNTVFKLYFQVWGLFAIASAAALPQALALLARRLGMLVPWTAGATLAVAAIGLALYPPLSAFQWDGKLAHWQGLDGLAYLGQANAAELDGIRWLDAHRQAGDVVLEAPGCSYGVTDLIPHDRVSMATGIPTIIGWNFHEYQWRNGQPEISARIQARQRDVNTIYEDATSAAAREVLDRYGVTYIYVGSLERSGYGSDCQVGLPYSAPALAKLHSLGWPVVFQQGDVTIYARPGSHGAPAN